MSGIASSVLAPAGTTGNNTHGSISISSFADQYALKFRITAAGATPTVTFKLQGSLENQATSDSTSDWFDLAMLPSDVAGPSEVASATKTAVATYAYFVNTSNRFAAKVRLVTSANTNVTYDATLVTRDVHQ